jgi:hypothetical protein
MSEFSTLFPELNAGQINQLKRIVLEDIVGPDGNTHWGACNNHGIGKPNYKCVCPVEPQNGLRAIQRQKVEEKFS